MHANDALAFVVKIKQTSVGKLAMSAIAQYNNCMSIGCSDELRTSKRYIAINRRTWIAAEYRQLLHDIVKPKRYKGSQSTVSQNSILD